MVYLEEPNIWEMVFLFLPSYGIELNEKTIAFIEIFQGSGRIGQKAEGRRKT